MPKPVRFGLDLGSSYVKVVAGAAPGKIRFRRAVPTSLDYVHAVARALRREGALPLRGAVSTGYGKHGLDGPTRRNEVSCLARAFLDEGHLEGTLVDIGGQDTKVLRFEDGRLKDFHLNRRCAAGTGSFAEFLMHRMRLSPLRLNALARETAESHRLNHFCTVFAATEIIDLVQKGTPLAAVARSVYVSVALRAREIAPLVSPLYLCGGFVAHHPIFPEIFKEVHGADAEVVAHPKFYSAFGAFLTAWDDPS